MRISDWSSDVCSSDLFDEMPVHDYSSAGEYEVRLYATNNYDDGKAPPSRAKKYRKEKAPAGNAGEPIPAGQATEGKSSAGRKATSGHFLQIGRASGRERGCQ